MTSRSAARASRAASSRCGAPRLGGRVAGGSVRSTVLVTVPPALEIDLDVAGGNRHAELDEGVGLVGHVVGADVADRARRLAPDAGVALAGPAAEGRRQPGRLGLHE